VNQKTKQKGESTGPDGSGSRVKKGTEHLKDPITFDNGKDLSSINLFVSIFNIFLGLTFAYFVFFSHQMSNIQSEIFSKVIEINAINIPYPFQFITVTGQKDYFDYNKRNFLLLEEFSRITDLMEKGNLSRNELSNYGKRVQMIITHIAYSYPYKPIIEIDKDGVAILDIYRHESINTHKNIEINLLRKQVDDIYNLNYKFTLKLKKERQNIAHAMFLAGNFKDDYIKSRIGLYLDSVIYYLDKHYELVIPLGLLIKKSDYILRKFGGYKILLFTILLSVNFIFGILIPLFWNKFRNKKLFYSFAMASFVLGMIILFREALGFLTI